MDPNKKETISRTTQEAWELINAAEKCKFHLDVKNTKFHLNKTKEFIKAMKNVMDPSTVPLIEARISFLKKWVDTYQPVDFGPIHLKVSDKYTYSCDIIY